MFFCHYNDRFERQVAEQYATAKCGPAVSDSKVPTSIAEAMNRCHSQYRHASGTRQQLSYRPRTAISASLQRVSCGESPHFDCGSAHKQASHEGRHMHPRLTVGWQRHPDLVVASKALLSSSVTRGCSARCIFPTALSIGVVLRCRAARLAVCLLGIESAVSKVDVHLWIYPGE